MLVKKLEEELEKEYEEIEIHMVDDLFAKKLADFKNESFREFINSKYLRKIDDTLSEKEKRLSKNEWINFFFATITSYHNRVIEKKFKFHMNAEQFERRPKTFLSYAYTDKGLSFALFIYFYLNGGFLFVDWMWNRKITDTALLKEIIYSHISTSTQFLFMRTAASELQVKYGVSIRQWCSWEIGNFYTVDKSNKFILNFYSNNVPNQILDTFKTMVRVVDGVIRD